MNYFLTSIYDGPKMFVHRKARRTFGYFDTLGKAYKAVSENQCNMQECLYNYLVIEGIGEGIHALCEEEHWFCWEGSQWKVCEKPGFLKGTVNFALG